MLAAIVDGVSVAGIVPIDKEADKFCRFREIVPVADVVVVHLDVSTYGLIQEPAHNDLLLGEA